MGNVIGSSLSRVRNAAMDHDIGTISAFRVKRECGKGDLYTRRENQQRHKNLKAKILHANKYGVTVVRGYYIENYGENSEAEASPEVVMLLVDNKDLGTLKQDLLVWGEEYDQDSILYVPKGAKDGWLIGTNHCDVFPGYHLSAKLGHPVFGQKGEFYTKVNNRSFTLPLGASGKAYDVSRPDGFMGRWACAAVAAAHWENVEVNDDDEF